MDGLDGEVRLGCKDCATEERMQLSCALWLVAKQTYMSSPMADYWDMPVAGYRYAMIWGVAARSHMHDFFFVCFASSSIIVTKTAQPDKVTHNKRFTEPAN